MNLEERDPYVQKVHDAIEDLTPPEGIEVLRYVIGDLEDLIQYVKDQEQSFRSDDPIPTRPRRSPWRI